MNSCAGKKATPGRRVVDAGVARDEPNRHMDANVYKIKSIAAIITEEPLMPQAQTFSQGVEFMRTNADADNWFLQIETFDPHEPFFTQPGWKEQYPHEYDGPLNSTGRHTMRVTESPQAGATHALRICRLDEQCAIIIWARCWR